ncbi:hypothetical protein FBU30_006971 [Linnemannia zychae]|nr:hypothetical protein FBU30_006971 [Linnemannia zychae]
MSSESESSSSSLKGSIVSSSDTRLPIVFPKALFRVVDAKSTKTGLDDAKASTVNTINTKSPIITTTAVVKNPITTTAATASIKNPVAIPSTKITSSKPIIYVDTAVSRNTIAATTTVINANNPPAITVISGSDIATTTIIDTNNSTETEVDTKGIKLDVATEKNNELSSEIDDFMCALFVQAMLISEDRRSGRLGKLTADSDPQIAIDHVLEEVQEMEKSYMLMKSANTCEDISEELLAQLAIQDEIAHSDRALALRLSQGDADAESSLRAANLRFDLIFRHFRATATCVACQNEKQSYAAPCGHGYCEDCAYFLYKQALADRSLIPVRCCKKPFAPEIVKACLTETSDINVYETIKHEIENPCPPLAELERAASKVISENGWKVCAQCGAVVEKISGCNHMTCICRYEFCYACHKKWGTCRCSR